MENIMYFQEKITDLNNRFLILNSVQNFIIYGIGEHTTQLLLHTNLSSFWDKAILVDQDAKERCFAGKQILVPEEVNWNSIDIAIISSFKWKKQIEETLKNCYKFKHILSLYSDKERHCFYHLYHTNKNISYGGNYNSWSQAKELCGLGYEAPKIFPKVFKDVLLKKDTLPKNFFLLYYCMLHFFKYQSLTIIDFGGGAAVQYWGIESELHKIIPDFKWFIIEQPNVVSLGKKYFSSASLIYCPSLSEVNRLIQNTPCLIYINGVLQYIPSYEEIVKQLLFFNSDTIIMERLLMGEKKRIIIQNVHDYIYEASYPAYLFDEEFYDIFMPAFSKKYEEKTAELFLSDIKAYYKNIVFERNSK